MYAVWIQYLTHVYINVYYSSVHLGDFTSCMVCNVQLCYCVPQVLLHLICAVN